MRRACAITASPETQSSRKRKPPARTATATVKKDVGIFVSGGTYGNGTPVAWKESGGFAGTFSPNAAFVHTVLPLQGGMTYTVTLEWKANKATSGAIYGAAGGGPVYSPTPCDRPVDGIDRSFAPGLLADSATRPTALGRSRYADTSRMLGGPGSTVVRRHALPSRQLLRHKLRPQ